MLNKTTCNQGAMGDRSATGRLLVVAVLLAGLVTTGCGMFERTSSAARPHEDPYVLFERGDHIAAYREFNILANRGDAGAQFVVGYLHETGNPRGGLFRGPDYHEAIKWYRLSAEQGFAKAQLNLGHMYAVGHGVARDDEEAARWYHKAAIQGFAEAQYNLGVRYYEGSGVTRNDVLAHMWASLAVANSTGTTQESATNLRDAVASRMTRPEISKAQQLAREWRPGVKVAALAPSIAPSREPPTTAAPESTGVDTESRLRTLKKLYDQGLITDKEYYEKRKQLLLGMFPAEDDLRVRGGKPTAAVREGRSGVAGEMKPEKKPGEPESFVKSGEGVVALGGGPQQARRGVVDRGSRGYIDRGGRDYIKWLQRSLNQILGTRLDVDGIMGRRTRNVIRSFQRQAGLAVDGVLGLQVEAALIKAGASPPRAGKAGMRAPAPASRGAPRQGG